MTSFVNAVINQPQAARPAPELDLLFAPHASGYAGADVGLSIPLPDGRVLWVFGDTLVGSTDEDARIWHAMPKNSIAIQPHGTLSADAIEWHYTDSAGEPREYFRLPENEAGEWFWPGTGCVVGNELFVFGFGVVDAASDCEALAFRVVRGWLFRVSDVSGDPSGWKYTAAPIAWTEETIFSSACIIADDFLHLFGVQMRQHDDGQKPAVLARVRLSELLECGATAIPEFYCAGGKWSRDKTARLEPLHNRGVTECSIYYDAPRSRYLATAYTGSAPEFLVSVASALTGPWTEPTPVYRSRETEPVDQYLYYTFRMHPQLASGPDEMVMSYVINARHPAELQQNTSIYFPRFIRVDLKEI